jgi:2-haloacid dehalogenase
MIRALIFDVFGTLVDWRGSIARQAEAMLKPRGGALDWLAFADAWRGEYQPSMERIRSGGRGYVKLDILHRENLDRVLPRFGLDALDQETRVRMNLFWHRLDAWPDVCEGLAALGERFLLAPCSNGNIALMAGLARHNCLRWDAILGADIARDYKPKPEVYLAACDAFNLAPDEVLMVAAHSSDLARAAAQGLGTAHVARIEEYGPNSGEAKPLVPVDFSARDLPHLAEMLA